ncbi:hypothetical protein ZEAMMB73_Zm00001d014567 [Zea mays]|nr:hypothetical protein ZEAMMB73_Zm00001d014567 [Zea mays]
MYASKIQEIRR